MNTSGTKDFLSEIKELKRPIDDDIELLELRGNGLRITGFCRVNCGLMRDVLQKYERKCKYTTTGDMITIDTFHDTGQESLKPSCALETLPNMAQVAATKVTIVKSSVAQDTYTYTSIDSDDIARILSSRCVINVILQGKEIKVTRVETKSIGIKGGLHDQLLHKRMGYRPYSKIIKTTRFKPIKAVRKPADKIKN